MSREGNIFDLAAAGLDSVVEALNLRRIAQQVVSEGALDGVAGDDDAILLRVAPRLEQLTTHLRKANESYMLSTHKIQIYCRK